MAHINAFQCYESESESECENLVSLFQGLFLKILSGKSTSINYCSIRGVTGFLGSEERRLKDTQNLKCEDRRFQTCLVLKTEDLATKPTKPED